MLPHEARRSVLFVAGALGALLQLCASAAAQSCSQGDAVCFCKAIGGTRVASPSVIRPTCRKTVASGGLQRVVDIYFPTDIGKPGTSFQPWVHLHGVTWAPWWLSKHPEWQQGWPAPMGGDADASRMNALTGSAITSEGAKDDGSAGQLKLQGHILIVPQGTGDVADGQMWNALYWTCMSTQRCVDSSVDDVGFLASLISSPASLLPGLPLKQQSTLSGYSNGGMMAQALLCKRPELAHKLSGVALLASIMGTSFGASNCTKQLPRALPILWLHGYDDQVLPYKPGRSVGVETVGAVAATKLWAARSGCADAASKTTQKQQQSAPFFSDAGAGVACENLCAGTQGAPPVVLCSATGMGHGVWDQPATGYTAGLALWAFRGFQGRPQPLS